MGVSPRASEGVVETLPRLPEAISWVRIDNVPVLSRAISGFNSGLTETRLENQSGATIQWRAVLPGAHEALVVDGREVQSRVRRSEGGLPVSFVELELQVGEKKTVTTIER